MRDELPIFILFLFFILFSISARAWNDEYSELPVSTQRTVCVSQKTTIKNCAQPNSLPSVSESQPVCTEVKNPLSNNGSGFFSGGSITIRSTPPDEECLEGEERFRLVVGQQIKGSWALIPSHPIQGYFPLPKASWPNDEEGSRQRLWHFSCFLTSKTEVLGFPVEKRALKGEITTPQQIQSCEAASVMADKFCKEIFKGNEIYENCSGGTQW